MSNKTCKVRGIDNLKVSNSFNPSSRECSRSFHLTFLTPYSKTPISHLKIYWDSMHKDLITLSHTEPCSRVQWFGLLLLETNLFMHFWIRSGIWRPHAMEGFYAAGRFVPATTRQIKSDSMLCYKNDLLTFKNFFLSLKYFALLCVIEFLLDQ
jgi:hypothetical protein